MRPSGLELPPGSRSSHRQVSWTHWKHQTIWTLRKCCHGCESHREIVDVLCLAKRLDLAADTGGAREPSVSCDQWDLERLSEGHIGGVVRGEIVP